MRGAQRRTIGALAVGCVALAACSAAGEHWHGDLQTALSLGRSQGADVVVFFARPGEVASDHTAKGLRDERVLAALAQGGFVAAVVAVTEHERLYEQWVGGRDRFGTVVLDAAGEVYAARPGPQDADELAALLRRCAATRAELAAARAAVAADLQDPVAQHRLGCVLLGLGARHACEGPLVVAAMAGVLDARHRLARLHALDGKVQQARTWLTGAPPTAPARASEAYVLFKEGEYAAAAKLFEAALQSGRLGEDRQWAMLYLGKAWHADRLDDRAAPLLESLAQEGTGSTFEAAARHTLEHLRQGPQPGDGERHH